MIGTFLLFLATWILKIPLLILLSINWIIPEVVIDVLAWAGQYTVYLNGDLPLYPDPQMSGPAGSIGIIQIMVAGFSFLAMFFTYRIAIRFIHLIRGN